MSKGKRVGSVLVGLLTILLSLLLFLWPEIGMVVIIIVIAFTLTFYGLGLLTLYSALTRHMVGGKYILYLGMVVFRLGLLTFTMTGVRTLPVFIYLFAMFIFSGALDVMKAFEEKKNKAPFWIPRLLFGLLAISLGILSVICCFFLKSQEGLTVLFAIALLYNGFTRIIKAFRKTSVVYIQ